MDKVIEIAGMYNVVVGLGGVGVLFGVCSLWLRYREVKVPWARRLCLFSDILNTTFVSITVVGVLTVSFHLAIHLPDLARSQEIPKEVDVSDLAKKADIDRMIQELGKKRDLYSTITSLHESQELDKNSLTLAVGRILGNIGKYESISLAGNLPGGRQWWHCHNDGPFQCSIYTNGR